ncbi:hypothetical protein AVEN_111903-1 [Araneus ventricosus]|uniref:Uncharacterized protein n=1 Tax=Araneus ventricosus TaxID=182803 RepID=A0A4Y2WFT4_ARAVE|nr:hypothetical protein AVEN_111903-1 [Araneus ventricosus]
MSVFAGARKCNLKILAEELEEKVDDSHKLKDLKKMILASKEYDKEYAKEWLNTIMNERKEREENERRKEEMDEQKRQEEITELKLEPAVNKLYGFGNQMMLALTFIGRIKADTEIDNVNGGTYSYKLFLTMRSQLILSSDGHGLISLILLIQK